MLCRDHVHDKVPMMTMMVVGDYTNITNTNTNYSVLYMVLLS